MKFLTKKIYQKYKQKGFLGLIIEILKYIKGKPNNPNISLIYRACFIHIPKCGGTTVEQLIFNDNNDRYSEDESGGRYYGTDHSNILAFSKYYHFYIFTFVRNPYTRIISIFNYYMNNGNGGYSDSILIILPGNQALATLGACITTSYQSANTHCELTNFDPNQSKTFLYFTLSLLLLITE